MARDLGVSEGTVRRRLANLLSDHIIRVVAIAEPEQLGYHTSAFIGLQVDPARVEAVATELASLGETEHVSITTGAYVREAMKDTFSALEEGKADILGLYMITALAEKGELPADELMDHYVTFMTSIFRSVRFGASSAHGKASMVRFNFFQDAGAFSRDPVSGVYRINVEKMQTAMTDLSRLILILQGNGDYQGAVSLLAEEGVVSAELQADLDRLQLANIPVDITFIQGKQVLGL